MAMLVLPEVFERTWGIARAAPFWPRRDGRGARASIPVSSFMAEVYWDLEWALQQQGFDYTYDKRLYDRLRDGHARPVREHLCAGLASGTSWRASWRTTTSRARPPSSPGRRTAPRP